MRLKPVAARSVDRIAVNDNPVSWRSFDRDDWCKSSFELTLDEEEMEVTAFVICLEDGYCACFDRGDGECR